MIKLLILIFSFNAHLLADSGEKILAGFDPVTDAIADNYLAGSYLMYDCQEGHWVCVTETFYNECLERRENESSNSSPLYSCAPVGPLPTKKSCFQRQLFMTTHNYSNRICLNNNWKLGLRD